MLRIREACLFAEITGALIQDRLCRTQVFFLDFKYLRAAADGVYDNAGDKGDGDSCVVATDRKVDEVPALRPSSEP